MRKKMQKIYLNVNEGKKENLLLELEKIDKRKIYNLYLLSCYFNPKSIVDIVSGVSEFAKINETYVYIDRREAIFAGVDLNKKIIDIFKRENLKINYEIRVVDSDVLFHTKAYALISADGDNNGSLVVGSANLTKQGLTNKSGNIETLISTQDKNVISDFIKGIDEIKTLDLDDVNDFANSNSIAFKLALLSQGYFVHRWSDTIKQHFSVPYNLSEKGKKEIKNKDSLVGQLGFNIDAATISKNYFNFSFEPRGDSEVNSLIRNYGIETYLGYWIPKVIFDRFATQKSTKLGFSDFLRKIKGAWKKQKDSIGSEIENDFSQLKKDGLLELPKRGSEHYNPFEKLSKKIDGEGEIIKSADDPDAGLLNNKRKLERIFLKLSEIDFPFDISNSKEINDIFEDINYTIESKNRKNRAMYAFILAVEEVNIDALRTLSEIEKSKEKYRASRPS
jgi:hypothetical protein